MQKIIIAILVLVIVGLGVYYFVFSGPSKVTKDVVESTPPTSSTSSAQDIVVNIKDFSFSPKTLVVKVGTKVTWVNNDSAPHTITSDSDNILNSNTISPNGSFSFVFTSVGSTNYHCTIHPSMQGTVIVEN